MLAVAAVWALCALADAPRIRRTSWAWLLWLLPWLVLLLTQGGELWRGFLLWINCILTNWNTVHESALRLFDTDAGVQSVLAISLLAAVFCAQLSWLLVSRRQLLICGLLGAALFLLQLLDGAFSSWGCALYLCGYLALWMSAPKLAPNLATIKRYYLYTPVSTGHLLLADSKERYDTRLMPTGLSGPEQYAVEEYSPVLPSELTVTAAWLAEPETPAQARYCEAESVYRAFVYNTYTTPDAALAPVLQTLFWDNYEPEHESVYASVCRAEHGWTRAADGAERTRLG